VGGADVVGLVTTVNEAFDRVAMHGVRRELLQAQADAAGLPVWEVPIPYPCSNEEYEARMRALIDRAAAEGVRRMAFGDLFLEDIRRYRQEKLDGTGIEPVFPLWGRPTRPLLAEMVAGGLRAVITCVDPRVCPAELAGQELADADLPPHVDPCGENGEFHTFCWSGPMFRAPIPVRVGEIVTRDGFVFADVGPEVPAVPAVSGRP
jgi:diphthamide synthase (EF-2-diphthine--ammonia ligase)